MGSKGQAPTPGALLNQTHIMTFTVPSCCLLQRCQQYAPMLLYLCPCRRVLHGSKKDERQAKAYERLLRRRQQALQNSPPSHPLEMHALLSGKFTGHLSEYSGNGEKQRVAKVLYEL